MAIDTGSDMLRYALNRIKRTLSMEYGTPVRLRLFTDEDGVVVQAYGKSQVIHNTDGWMQRPELMLRFLKGSVEYLRSLRPPPGRARRMRGKARGKGALSPARWMGAF